MAWLIGVVTYSAKKQTKDGQSEYGMLGVEGITMFCDPKLLAPTGTEVRVFVQGQSRKADDGTYNSSINALSVQRVSSPHYQAAVNGHAENA